ncbi:MAG: response regulator transcription factor [Cyclobacteriaceae bacterium]
MTPTKVLLSDFQFLTREGLIKLIDSTPQLELHSVHEGPEGLLHEVVANRPDVLLIDYQGRDPILISTLKQIVESNATNVLIITNDSEKESIQQLLNLGVRGIITKSCSKQEIINAIESVARHNRFYCNRILEIVMTSPVEQNNCEPTDLSPREYEVLQLITKGHKTVEIADKLHVSVHTINSHRKNILKKLNLKSPAELIVYAMESGLVS